MPGYRSIGTVQANRQPALAIRLNADMFLSKRGSLDMFRGSGPNDVWVSSVSYPADGYLEYRYEPIYSVNFPFSDAPFDQSAGELQPRPSMLAGE